MANKKISMILYSNGFFQVSYVRKSGKSVRKSMVKSAESVRKTKCCDDSEFRVVKGNKSKASSSEFSVKMSNRFEVLLRDCVTSIADGITELEERKTKRELIPRRMEKNKNVLTTKLVSQNPKEEKGTFNSNQLTTTTVESTDVYKRNKVFFQYDFFLANLANL